MAKYPIVSQRGVPSPSGGFRASLSFPGAEGDLWQQIGRLAEKGQDLVLTQHLQRAFLEFEDAKSKEELEDINFVKALRENKDEKAYDSLLQKSIGKRQSFMPKNPLAAQKYRSYMKEREVELAEDVSKAQFIRRRETAQVERDAASADGDMARVAEITEAGIKTGLFDESEAREYHRKAVTTHQYKMATQMAIRDPETMLNFIRSDGTLDPALGFDALDVGHGQAIRNIAENSIFRREKLEDQRKEGVRRELLKKWMEGTLTSDDILKADLSVSESKQWQKDIGSQNKDIEEDDYPTKRIIEDATDAFGMGDMSRAEVDQLFLVGKDRLTESTRNKLYTDLEGTQDTARSYHRQEGWKTLRTMIFTGGTSELTGLTMPMEGEESQYERARKLWEIEVNEQSKAGKYLPPDEEYARCKVIAEKVKRQVETIPTVEALKKSLEGKPTPIPDLEPSGEPDLSKMSVEELRSMRGNLQESSTRAIDVSSWFFAMPRLSKNLYNALSDERKDRFHALLQRQNFAEFIIMSEKDKADFLEELIKQTH